MIPSLDARPILIGIAGPNGAGKSMFYTSQVSYTGLTFVNADVIAVEAGIGAYEAADVAEAMRRARLARQESFIFETVFSDQVADKISFMEDAAAAGYSVVLFFVGVSAPDVCVDRVAQRVIEGGHDVPADKLIARFPRVMENLRQAMLRLPLVLVYDNDDLREPYRFCGAVAMGKVIEAGAVPDWLHVYWPAE